jgi:hypothetical protein
VCYRVIEIHLNRGAVDYISKYNLHSVLCTRKNGTGDDVRIIQKYRVASANNESVVNELIFSARRHPRIHVKYLVEREIVSLRQFILYSYDVYYLPGPFALALAINEVQ